MLQIETGTTLDTFLKLGMGGLVVWVTLQLYSKTLVFLDKRKNGNGKSSSGALSKEEWVLTIKQIVAEENSKVITILEKQTEILNKLAENAAEERGARQTQKRRL